MTKNAQISLEGKDVLVILEIAFSRRIGVWTFLAMAEVLGLSPSQVHASVGRLVLSGLLTGKGLNGKINREALAEFLIHGARYMLPPVIGGRVRGVLTGASSGLFERSLVLDRNESDCLVWPHATGNSQRKAVSMGFSMRVVSFPWGCKSVAGFACLGMDSGLTI